VAITARAALYYEAGAVAVAAGEGVLIFVIAIMRGSFGDLFVRTGSVVFLFEHHNVHAIELTASF